jgi:uncharacterized membrane protein
LFGGVGLHRSDLTVHTTRIVARNKTTLKIPLKKKNFKKAEFLSEKFKRKLLKLFDFKYSISGYCCRTEFED